MAKNIFPRLFLLGLIVIFAGSPMRSFATISPFLPFGGKIISITPNVDPFCPVGSSIVTVGLPTPMVAIFTNVPGLVLNPPASVGDWTLGLAFPPIPPCLPVVMIMGVSRIGFGF